MTRYFNAPPLLLEDAFGIKEEGAAINTSNLLAIHILHFDDTKDGAQFFFSISYQLKG